MISTLAISDGWMRMPMLIQLCAPASPSTPKTADQQQQADHEHVEPLMHPAEQAIIDRG